jgi:hypothetical protein
MGPDPGSHLSPFRKLVAGLQVLPAVDPKLAEPTCFPGPHAPVACACLSSYACLVGVSECVNLSSLFQPQLKLGLKVPFLLFPPLWS